MPIPHFTSGTVSLGWSQSFQQATANNSLIYASRETVMAELANLRVISWSKARTLLVIVSMETDPWSF